MVDFAFTSAWLDIALDGLVNLSLAAIIFFIGWSSARLIAALVKRILISRGINDPLQYFIITITRVALTFVALMVSLDFLGFDTAVLLTVFAAAGLAIGLALKDTLSNVASGVMLILFKPFTIGDYVEAAGVGGVVEKIGIFTSQMKTGDNREITVPNSQIYGGVIINASAKQTRRIDLVIGVGYSDDLQKVEQLLLECITDDQRILTTPEPTVAVAELADNSVNFIVRPWVNTADYWLVRWHLIRQIKVSFDENGISIPYPQQDIHIHQVTKD
ncbi:mechanosensitive ion channel [Oceanospirillaceae bacterium]|jgi:small conductance mechanosensitive channel|uniref:mechanosensitive ion channel family protein n=1 Tax=Candidatus Njordibacter sp. Uisw_002 TaxID=3230971 RepID=UPI0023348351|nr:mechanosensitive ion channel [Oceanospirillaceae bacterium]MDB9958745.1 mechanosensitive ion channel [Oceanospirillaceae bacterium]MDC1340409.1 mechanosensitive ion channel [Oceanospirillaceae bacterium]|tara:strand:+ start:5899 stop:6720 length:822 start_codon:yes stop_codon:yes gene_type:complete